MPYKVDNKEFCVATDRFDLAAEEVALVYRLRWDVEIFFGWWKLHLKVYHLIARSAHGLMAQILGGLITCLLLASYCQEEHREKVSISRVRELCRLVGYAFTFMLTPRAAWQQTWMEISKGAAEKCRAKACNSMIIQMIV